MGDGKNDGRKRQTRKQVEDVNRSTSSLVQNSKPKSPELRDHSPLHRYVYDGYVFIACLNEQKSPRKRNKWGHSVASGGTGTGDDSYSISTYSLSTCRGHGLRKGVRAYDWRQRDAMINEREGATTMKVTAPDSVELYGHVATASTGNASSALSKVVLRTAL